jgi:hypothetical protein
LLNPPGHLDLKVLQDHQDRVVHQEKMEVMEAEGVLDPKDLEALQVFKERLERKAQEDREELLDHEDREDRKDPAD